METEIRICDFGTRGNRSAGYTGFLKNGNRHGLGTMRYPNGDELICNWVDDTREGQGILMHADGRVQAQEYKRGKLINGHGTRTLEDGTVKEYNVRDGELINDTKIEK